MYLSQTQLNQVWVVKLMCTFKYQASVCSTIKDLFKSYVHSLTRVGFGTSFTFMIGIMNVVPWLACLSSTTIVFSLEYYNYQLMTFSSEMFSDITPHVMFKNTWGSWYTSKKMHECHFKTYFEVSNKVRFLRNELPTLYPPEETPQIGWLFYLWLSSNP